MKAGTNRPDLRQLLRGDPIIKNLIQFFCSITPLPGEGLRGGGISNFKLYGTTEPIPDGGGTFALLGATLFTAGALRKATRRKL